MRRVVFLFLSATVLLLANSCGNNNSKVSEGRRDSKVVRQKADGTISLDLRMADCYNNEVDPSGNTAEWNVVVSKSGRYNVWISSTTRDTTNLNYKNNVKVNIQDTRLEKHPKCDKVIRNATDVEYPYFKADSFLGSMYIQDTGLLNIQVISEKIMPKDFNPGTATGTDYSKLISVSLTPEIR